MQNSKIFRNFFVLTFGLIFFISPLVGKAQSSELVNLSARIDQDTNKSNEFVDYLNDTDDDLETVVSRLDEYHQYFIDSRDYLYSLSQNIDPKYQKVTQLLNQSSQKYVSAIGLLSYSLSYEQETQTGEDELSAAITDRNNAINEYNTIQPSDDVFVLYIILVSIFSLTSLWLFLISIRKGSTELEHIKAQAKRDLFKSSLWPTVGAVATATWYYLTPPGGTYFVLWGPVLFGAIAFARSFLHFVFKIRPELNKGIKAERRQQMEKLRNEVPITDKKGTSYFGSALIVLILIGSWFYWFQWRPMNIKKECSWKKGGDSWFQVTSSEYSACLHQHGL